MSLANYQKYEKYVDSGVPWIGYIPESWELKRGKWFCKYLKELNTNKSCENILSLTLRGVVRNNADSPEGLVPQDYITYQIFQKNDLVFKLIDLQNISTSRVGLVSEKGIMSPAYLRIEVSDKIHPKFLYYFYYSMYLEEVYNKLGSGVRSTLNQHDLLNLPIFLLDKKIQINIANFLDQKTSEIDQAIKKKQKLINLLKEQKDIIIQKAVTQGLDPSIKMKDSKAPWIAKIPEHWELCKFRNLFKAVSVKNRPKLQLLSVVREKGIIVRDLEDQESNHNFIPEDLNGYKLVNKGQFVVNKMKAWQGSYGISSFQGIVSPAYYTFDVMKNMDKEFLNYAIRSKFYIPFFKSASDGVRIGQWDLSISRMKEILFIYPSQIEEQRQIVSFIKEAEKQIFELINSTELEIEKLKEFKQVLIANAVTGKIKI